VNGSTIYHAFDAYGRPTGYTFTDPTSAAASHTASYGYHSGHGRLGAVGSGNIDFIEHAVVLILVALIGNFILRRILMRMAQSPDVDEELQPISLAGSPDGATILAEWGEPAAPTAQVVEGVHPEIAAVLSRFSKVAPDEFTQVIDRNFAAAPWASNSAFVQIGVWVDGAPVLVKRDLADSCVYMCDIHSSSPDHPSTLAKSIEEYLQKCWLLTQQSEDLLSNVRRRR
jgi:uncharacterized membrane protein